MAVYATLARERQDRLGWQTGPWKELVWSRAPPISWLYNLDLSFNLCEAFPHSQSLHYAFPHLNHLVGGFENYIRYVKPATLQVLHNCLASIGICVGAFYWGGGTRSESGNGVSYPPPWQTSLITFRILPKSSLVRTTQRVNYHSETEYRTKSPVSPGLSEGNRKMWAKEKKKVVVFPHFYQ